MTSCSLIKAKTIRFIEGPRSLWADIKAMLNQLTVVFGFTCYFFPEQNFQFLRIGAWCKVNLSVIKRYRFN